MRPLVIFGTRNFAEIADYFFTTDSAYKVVAFTVDSEYLEEDTFKGRPVVPFDELESTFPPGEADVFVAIGINAVNRMRAERVEAVQKKGYALASFIHSTACVPSAIQPGPNTMIMDNVLLHPYVQVGFNTIIWSRAGIALKCRIGNHCWITSAQLGESIHLGDYCFVGLGAIIAPFLHIGARTVIGAGAVIQDDLDEASVVKAAACRVARFKSDRLRNFR